MDIVNNLHNIIDDLIVEYPGQFPDGPDFWNGLQQELKYFVEDGDIDSWVLSPRSDDGFKLRIIKDSKEMILLRESDGGKKA